MGLYGLFIIAKIYSIQSSKLYESQSHDMRRRHGDAVDKVLTFDLIELTHAIIKKY